VQNLYNLTNRRADPTLEYCRREGLAFISWFPIGGGVLTSAAGTLQSVAAEQHATPAQVALAWLLHHSPAMLPIPGTASVAHLEENVGAAGLRLSDDQYLRLVNGT
jgi:aryl-alcohol dehydrogenase-like predicted oxidoreductase